MAKRRLSPKPEWYEEHQRFMMPVALTIMAPVEVIVRFVIETIKLTGQPYNRTRAECLADLGDRLADHGMATEFDVTPEDEATLGAAARRYAREAFPDLPDTEPEAGPLANDYLIPDEQPANAGRAGPTFILVCPVCGDRSQTTGSPSDDGTTYAIPLEGNCGHRWVMKVKTEGQKTRLFVEIVERKPTE